MFGTESATSNYAAVLNAAEHVYGFWTVPFYRRVVWAVLGPYSSLPHPFRGPPGVSFGKSRLKFFARFEERGYELGTMLLFVDS